MYKIISFPILDYKEEIFIEIEKFCFLLNKFFKNFSPSTKMFAITTVQIQDNFFYFKINPSFAKNSFSKKTKEEFF